MSLLSLIEGLIDVHMRISHLDITSEVNLFEATTEKEEVAMARNEGVVVVRTERGVSIERKRQGQAQEERGMMMERNVNLVLGTSKLKILIVVHQFAIPV